MNETIYYKNGHTCVPNGVGDYAFICPTHGQREGFVPFMMRSLQKGNCSCGIVIELDEQPKSANAKGILSPCPKCDSVQVHVTMSQTFRKLKEIGSEVIFFRTVSCLDCGNSTSPIEAWPGGIVGDDEKSHIDRKWKESAFER
ncbi:MULTISPECIES: hypothetical protein [Pseudomonas aeruginosa group]|uniref:hypothetical protein n=1 Tax=Pseudomonas aeruginosa group TaxID=136841 RepID=UPI001F39C6F4|nr:hypothetical protein [Pseudomonas pseudonitroreducens]